MTRNGIVYDLLDSPYFLTIDNFTYYFSSEVNKRKFSARVLENRKNINYSLTMRFDINIIFNPLCDIVLYRKIEKRGFRIKEGNIELCQKNLVLNGHPTKRKN